MATPETSNDFGRFKRVEETLEGIRSDVAATKGSMSHISQEFQAFKQAIMGDETTGSRGVVWRINHLETKMQAHLQTHTDDYDKRLTKIEKLVYGILLVAGSVTVIVQILMYIKA